MQKFIRLIQKSFISLVISIQVLVAPASILAAESSDGSSSAAAAASSSTEAPAPASEPTPVPAPTPSLPVVVQPTAPVAVAPAPSTGPAAPTGSASSTYSLNPATGLWENDQYTWDPVTHQTKPKVAPSYSFNPATQMWDTTEWYFQPETGKYVPNTVSSSRRPLGNLSISNTGPSSNNGISVGGTSNGTFDLFFNGSISNHLSSNATSGNALLQGNTIGGSATSGDAQAIANVLNLLQSSWGENSDIATFIANLDGSVFGDLLLDPNALAGPGGNSNIDVNISNNARIDNDIDLAATSGDASVTGNTQAGDATSGNARALVNLFNLINSSISADKSFIGILNINGDLDGDILLPPGLLEYLIASTGPNSNNQISGNNNNNLDVTSDTNRNIANNVDTNAGTGNATVDQNTSAGSAGSGTADTQVNTLNLVGQNVNAKNGLLVFVNVFGKWVGLLMNAPQGTSSIATTGPNSNNTINADGSNNISVDATENSQINNNINASAQSGDATVSGNTQAGNARSGDAFVGVNIFNAIDSNLNFSDFFGVLFINVFGSWNGSFGVDTAAGNRPAAAASGLAGSGGGTFQFDAAANQETRQNTATTNRSRGAFGLGSIAGGGNSTTSTQQVAGATAANNASLASPVKNDSQAAVTSKALSNFQFWLLTFGAAILIGAFLFADRVIALARKTVLLSRSSA